jgi:drug/metabolite transporter (DMT)-like permease
LAKKDMGRQHAPRFAGKQEAWVAAGIGLTIGFYDGFFGPGTGSFLVFAYVWLLGVSTPAKVSTYAYVNPVIAVFLGWALLGERVTSPMVLAAGMIVGAVIILTWPRTAPAKA